MISSFSYLTEIADAYRSINEAAARATSFKNLTPEQAEELAKLSPTYVSNTNWGKTSGWICSCANRMVKYANLAYEKIFEKAVEIKPFIDAFEKSLSKQFSNNIDKFKTFDELKSAVSKFTDENGNVLNQQTRISNKMNGRARQCYSLIVNGEKGGEMSKVYEDCNWLVSIPCTFEYNMRFAPIGKWCHTTDPKYWNSYTKGGTPLYYILNKSDGRVFCLSNTNNELRDQLDNYPEYENENGEMVEADDWNGIRGFFTANGAEEDMLDAIEACDSDSYGTDVSDNFIANKQYDEAWMRTVAFKDVKNLVLKNGHDRVEGDMISFDITKKQFQDANDDSTSCSWPEFFSILGLNDCYSEIGKWDIDDFSENFTQKYGFNTEEIQTIAYTGRSNVIRNSRKVSFIINELNHNFYKGMGYNEFYLLCDFGKPLSELKEIADKTMKYGFTTFDENDDYDDYLNDELPLRFDFSRTNATGIITVHGNGSGLWDLLRNYCNSRNILSNPSFHDHLYEFNRHKFDDEKFAEGLGDFVLRLESILNRKEDADGQLFFDFDKNYRVKDRV